MTVELPENVARRAEEKAAQLGIPLSEFVARAVEEKAGVDLTDVDLAKKPWMRMFGSLRHLHEENMRIDRIIEEEFEQIEPEAEF